LVELQEKYEKVRKLVDEDSKNIPSGIWLWNTSRFFWSFTVNVLYKLSDSNGDLSRCVSGVKAVSYPDLFRVSHGAFCHYFFGRLRKNILGVFTSVLPWIFFVFVCSSTISYLGRLTWILW
jgi:hypothetical protein